MQKACVLTVLFVYVVFLQCSITLAEDVTFEYPIYLVYAHKPDNNCWVGMDVDGHWYPTVYVVPERWLVGPPPSEKSGVTLPTDSWIELRYAGQIVDGLGDDILIIEWGQCGEQALIFLIDGFNQEYLLGLATALNAKVHITTEIGFDISSIPLNFIPNSIRIVALDLGGGSPGFDVGSVQARIWSKCEEKAYLPNPFDGAKNVFADAVLSWSPGCFADKHIIYFSSDPNSIALSDNAGSDQGQLQNTNIYDPGYLEFGETYYWRVDEVNQANTDSPWIGDIWSFTVADCLTVDDFDSYNNSDNVLYKLWDVTGAGIGITNKPVYSCTQSMSFYYYCDAFYYSEAGRSFSPSLNWTVFGARVLELSFFGNVNNEGSGQIYVSLSDGISSVTVPYEGNANDLREEKWHFWRIDLEDFAEINLSNVKSISIGIRLDPSQSSGWASGIVYFDDIKLCGLRCLKENVIEADFNADCMIDFEDLQELALNWLEKGYNIYQIIEPKEPVAWYKFDTNAKDSVGYAHGHVVGQPNYVPGVYEQAIEFDGFRDSVTISDATDLFNKLSNGITITFWQYGLDSAHQNKTICCSNYEYGQQNPAIAINLGCFRYPGRYNWDCGYPWSFDNRLSGEHRYKSEWSGRWNHWAFVKDSDKGIMQIYLNGVLYDSRAGSYSPISDVSSFEIGSGWYGGYDGLIDDFRIYDYALSQPEIAYVATNGTGVFDQTLMTPADINADERIDFADFAILSNNWLEQSFWP